ncbi:PREDICTED: zinc finger MYM-type protein 1-like [Prunus mume]|uniref:Zinc finger MYM-type protein 1-like n=1 Tax=Prunus mume TaxID=102107 RepID=A0ABM0PL51_PRUMU|nr:PREDICTED: zinc finger MYM-type protein 1-like [Prunus mume]
MRAFCLYCYLFKTNFEQVGSEAFTGDGFKNWKKWKERFKMHVGPVGSVHNKARKAATKLMNQNTHIEMAVSKHSDQACKVYCTCLNASIKCTKVLLQQGLAFRGHDESVTSSNRGNYLELLQFLANNDDKVKEVVMENAPGNLKLLAPCIQKEIVNSCALETLDVVMDGLKDRFFSILVDEARNVSVKEQMAMVLRYVDNKGHVIEIFMGIQHVTDTTSSSLKDAINTFVSRNGLSLSKLRGQGYDGASNMRAILGLTNDLSQVLQRKDQEIVNAMALVKSCKEKLHWMRNNGFNALVNEVSSFCEKHHIDVPNMEEAFILPERSRRNAPIKTNRHHYCVNLFIYVIDEQITELEDRFNKFYRLQLLQYRELFLS